MKAGPLLSPATFREFIYPHLRRMVDVFRSYGVRYFAVDTDGKPHGVDPAVDGCGGRYAMATRAASDVDPLTLRQRFGNRCDCGAAWTSAYWRRDRRPSRAHLRDLIPLIEEGGYIPAVDHTVPPDVSWDNFRYYMDAKMALLAGEFSKLD
jgi:uroporphyrinogen decarboxylase